MKKTKIPRKKVRGKNMKRLFACLLSLSMIPTNGVVAFASENQANIGKQQNVEVKTQAEESEISFAQESLTSKIGCFKTYKFNGVDATQISRIKFKCDTNDYLDISSQTIYDSTTKERSKGYMIYPKKEGTTKVTATIWLKDQSSITLSAVELKVQKSDDDMVPIIDHGLYSNLSYQYFYNTKDAGYITKTQMESLKKIELNSNSSTVVNLKGLSYATNCEELDLSGQSKITDISELSKMDNLKKINLANTKISDISALNKLKDNLEYLNLKNTNVSTEARYSMMQSKDVSIEAGTESTSIVCPRGLVTSDDTVVSENPDVVKAELKDTENGEKEWTLQTADDQEGKETKIVVSNVESKKEVKISVVGKDKQAPDFEQKSIDTNIGSFKEIELKNIEDVKIKLSSKDNSIAKATKDQYTNKYYIEPQGEGTTTIVGTFEKNGKKYTSKMTINVSKEKDGVIPIKSYEIYSRLRQEYEGKMPEEITERQLKYKDNLSLTGCNISNDDINWIVKAKYCSGLFLGGNTELTDISKLTELNNLRYLDIQNTSVGMSEELNELSKHLKDLRVQGSKVSTAERFDLIRTKKITVIEGNKNKSAVLPTGLVQSSDTCTVEDKDVAEVSVQVNHDYPYCTEVSVTGKDGQAGKKTNLVITAEDGTTKKIPIEVVSNNVGFAENETDAVVGQFKEVEYKNADKIKDVKISVAPEDSEKLKLAEDHRYNFSGEREVFYRLSAQASSGTAKLIGTFTDNDGNVTTDTMTVTLTQESNVVPIKSYALYRGLFVDEHTDEGKTSADVNRDYAISPKELAAVNQVRTEEYLGVTDEDLKILKDATECRLLSFSGEEDITNIDFAKYMPKLEYVYINGTNISDISSLNNVKKQLKRVRFDDTKISIEDRFAFIQDLTINVQEGTEQKINIEPERIIEDGDKLSIDNDKIKIHKTEEDDEFEYIVDATAAKNGDKANLIISNGENEVKIPINVNEKSDVAPGFKYSSKKLNIGHFEKIEFKNTEGIYTSSISVEPMTDDDEKVITTSKYYADDDGGEIYFVPKGTGKATLKASFITEDGTIYTDYMEVNVDGLESDNYMPIKSLSFCAYAYDKEGNFVDKDKDFRLTKEEFSKITRIYMNGDWYVTDDDLDVLDSIKDQLTCLNLAGTSVSDEKRLSYIKKDVLMIEEGTSIKDLFGIDELIDFDEDTISVEDDTIAEFKTVYDEDECEAYGFVEAKEGQAGKTTNLVITTNDGTTKKIPIVVTEKGGTITLKSISLNKNEVSLTTGQKEKLVVSYQPETATDKNIKWISSDNSVVSVDEAGNITANKAGTAVITAEGSNGYKAYCKVNVNESQKPTQPTPEAPKPTPIQPTTAAPQKVAKITVTAPSNKLSAGKKVKLTANISNNASNKNIKWTTSNKKYATVDKNGVVKFNKKAAGKTVTITAYATDGSGKKATFKIKIMKGTVKKIKITGKKTVKAGKTLSLKAKVTASKGANKKLKWTSSNTKYATVSGSGKVKALKAGKKKSVKITAMATDGSGKKATVTIKIK